MVAIVALVVVGPKKLPMMLRTAGEWVGRLRKMTTEMRAQTGIDAILREEGIDGVQELRALLRGEIQAARDRYDYPSDEPTPPAAEDEYPIEGADAGGALADDLFDFPALPVSAGLRPAQEAVAS